MNWRSTLIAEICGNVINNLGEADVTIFIKNICNTLNTIQYAQANQDSETDSC